MSLKIKLPSIFNTKKNKNYSVSFLSFLLTAIGFFLISCQDPTSYQNEFPASGTQNKPSQRPADNESLSRNPLFLFSASCSEPFMYAECFTHKMNLIFPEYQDSVIAVFDSTLFASERDFTFDGLTVQGKKIHFTLKQKPCIHPGSGEHWPKTITFVIDTLSYQGCATNKKK